MAGAEREVSGSILTREAHATAVADWQAACMVPGALSALPLAHLCAEVLRAVSAAKTGVNRSRRAGMAPLARSWHCCRCGSNRSGPLRSRCRKGTAACGALNCGFPDVGLPRELGQVHAVRPKAECAGQWEKLPARRHQSLS